MRKVGRPKEPWHQGDDEKLIKLIRKCKTFSEVVSKHRFERSHITRKLQEMGYKNYTHAKGELGSGD